MITSQKFVGVSSTPSGNEYFYGEEKGDTPSYMSLSSMIEQDKTVYVDEGGSSDVGICGTANNPCQYVLLCIYFLLFIYLFYFILNILCY
jgi:hypothetical protein